MPLKSNHISLRAHVIYPQPVAIAQEDYADVGKSSFKAGLMHLSAWIPSKLSEELSNKLVPGIFNSISALWKVADCNTCAQKVDRCIR